ncbi:L-threonine 3-dehydrogenase [Candidatus Aerophobetes bacterium]|uniref:L-threonine 3-dehydrogenase n=1 Tax=Aerophobetes bacterium TaxID=2030807 RepID=A0A497E335_UNCAE|nr:MAG: L-threonine 3-dehydrogenase [Candidatus Aerophobetes bacterium]
MKAAVLEDLEKMVVKEVTTPQIGQGEILVRVRSCAVCGSDIRIYHRGNPRVKPPQIIGHEIAGEIVEVGSGVKKFKVGDRVALGADVPCGTCRFCRNGLGNNCPINYAIGYQFQGGFAEYIPLNELTVKYGPLHKIPGDLSFDEASLAEPLACCINGYELANLKLGDTVVVIGAGPVGLMLVELAKIMGADKVILSQRSRERLRLAQRFSADVLISSSEENFVERVMEETGGEGADVVMVACANPSAQEEALKVVGHRGRVNFFGGLPPGSSKISIDSNLIHYKECFVLGSHGSVPRQHKLALNLLAEGRIKGKDFITHHFALDDIKEAFEVAEGHRGLKVIVNP